jgi:hypothetical protein
MPIDAVSPSPDTPIRFRWWFARLAPVATAGMRPWTLLKPNDWPRKYAGVFDEQPMPDILATVFASIPSSKYACWIDPEIASWPQPMQSVDLPPL